MLDARARVVGMLEIEERENSLWIGLNRPEKRNALDEEMVGLIHGVLDSARKGAPRVLVLHSLVPGVFVSGADISELIERRADSAFRAINAELFDEVASFRWPSVALIDGFALGGGCELALACDFRIASPSSRFAQPELGLGILAGAGGNWRLAQLAGIAVARRMLYMGEVIGAEEALRMGLVDELVESDRLGHAALARVEQIASRSWRALELTKLALRSTEVSTLPIDILGQALLFESEEKRERMGRFLHKPGG